MKFPFDFSIKLIFRLVLPGFLLSLGVFPVLRIVLRMNGWLDKGEYAFIILIILLGWAIVICDMRVYMLFEGRRYWPRPLRWFFQKREQKRLERVTKNLDSKDERIKLEAFFELRNFPQDDDGNYVSLMPSRLGNLLTAFEGYSFVRYGQDSIFYWPRIWLRIDKDTREEIDNSQALADSTLYASFALFLAGWLWLLYAFAKLVIVIGDWRSYEARVQYDLLLIDQLLPRKGSALFIAAVFFLSFFIIYRLAYYLNGQFGELYKSVFDLYIVEVSTVTKELMRLTELSPAAALSRNLLRKDQYDIASRYLQYYRYRCAACNDLLKPNEISTHECNRKGWPFEPEPVPALNVPAPALNVAEKPKAQPPAQEKETVATDL
jgi:hypothetical protein